MSRKLDRLYRARPWPFNETKPLTMSRRRAPALTKNPGVISDSEKNTNLDTLQGPKTTLAGGSETVCRNPICGKSFAAGGMPQNPKRFCDGGCLQKASLIRRVATFYGVSVETLHEALTKARGK
jgi:hypothetical protein